MLHYPIGGFWAWMYICYWKEDRTDIGGVLHSKLIVFQTSKATTTTCPNLYANCVKTVATPHLSTPCPLHFVIIIWTAESYVNLTQGRKHLRGKPRVNIAKLDFYVALFQPTRKFVFGQHNVLTIWSMI